MMRHNHVRHTFFFSILLAAIVSTPLAAGVVALSWAGVDHARLLAESGSPALWSARTFLAYFDLFALAAWVPCAFCISLVTSRLKAAYVASATRSQDHVS
jgi:hypothetical protein